MWSLITSAITWLYNTFVNSTVVQFIAMGVLYFAMVAVVNFLTELMNLASYNAQDGLSGIGDDVLFWFDVFELEIGLPLIVSAVVIRFTIRRIPVIG